jgi:hypothetical protein
MFIAIVSYIAFLFFKYGNRSLEMTDEILEKDVIIIASRSVSLNTEPPKAIVIEKWATDASADKGSGAKQLIGKPDLGLNLGDPAVH